MQRKIITVRTGHHNKNTQENCRGMDAPQQVHPKHCKNDSKGDTYRNPRENINAYKSNA